MIDSYIILNRKTNLIIKIFLLNICIIIFLIIWGINTLEYQKTLKFHSKISNFNSYYILEVLVPVKEVNQITKSNQLLIGQKSYPYKIYQIENKITYKNNNNYQKLYLEVTNLDTKYKINNYRLNIEIPTTKKKIIKYFME